MDTLNGLENIDQELAELRNRLKQSFGVLDGLARVQTQFEDLAQTYQKFKEHLDEVKANRGDVAQGEATFNQRIAELEKVIDSKLRELKSELFKVENDARTTDIKFSAYSAELTKQVSDLKGEVEERLTVFLKEWASYKEAIQAPLDEAEARSRTELQALMKHLSEAGSNDQHLEKQQRLEHELSLTKSFLHDMELQVNNMERQLRNLERQLRSMSNWVVVAVLTTVLAVALALLK